MSYFKAKMHSAPPDPLAGFKGKEGKEKEGAGMCMTSGSNSFNDFPEIVPAREITAKIEYFSFSRPGPRSVSWMGLML